MLPPIFLPLGIYCPGRPHRSPPYSTFWEVVLLPLSDKSNNMKLMWKLICVSIWWVQRCIITFSWLLTSLCLFSYDNRFRRLANVCTSFWPSFMCHGIQIFMHWRYYYICEAWRTTPAEGRRNVVFSLIHLHVITFLAAIRWSHSPNASLLRLNEIKLDSE